MRNRIAPALLLAATPAAAHVMLAEPAAQPGARYTAQFKVEHGCSGAPTTALQVEIPAGVSAVAPQTPPGWSLAVVRADGRTQLVTWKGGTIPADRPGAFVVAMTLPATAGRLVFPVTQICGKTVVQWNQPPPAAGAPRPDNPAPVLNITPAPQDAMPARMKM